MNVPAIIKMDDRKEYYTSINTSDLDKPENLAIFLGKAEIESLSIAIAAAKGESIEEDEDFDKELMLLEQKLQAKKVSTPTKSIDIISDLLKNNYFPFLDKLVSTLSKFDRFFESISKDLRLDGGTTNNSLEKRKLEVLSKLSVNKVNNVYLIYKLTDIKNIKDLVEISIMFRIDFNRVNYTLSDNLINKKSVYKYNQFISEEEQGIWIKNIQKEMLNRIKKFIGM